VIAAAEARDKKNKNNRKPIPRFKGGKIKELSPEDRKRIEEQREELAKKNETYMSKEPMSEEAKKAVQAAKKDEAVHAAKLGYNPYESAKSSAQQAATATVTMTHGAVNAGTHVGGDNGNSNSSNSRTMEATNKTPKNDVHGPIDSCFDEAFATLMTTNQDKERLSKSLRILRKLILNATTDGQKDDKKRMVRISNANKHIQATIHDTNGALEIMMSVGFMIIDNEEDSETYLALPPGDTGPAWMPKALDRLDQFEQGL